jgi:hypothetical protein
LTTSETRDILLAMPAPLRRLPSSTSLPERAAADLEFIRGAMERSGSFTAVPGRGGMAMGVVALVAAASARLVRPEAWLAVWLAAAFVGLAIGLLTMRQKAASEGLSLFSGAGRRFLMCLGPALLAGALLTAGLARAGELELLPAVWLLCYGAGVVSAGAFSVPIVPAIGAAFLALGALALAAPPSWGDALMGLGFGGVQLVAGFLVARRHGG